MVPGKHGQPFTHLHGNPNARWASARGEKGTMGETRTELLRVVKDVLLLSKDKPYSRGILRQLVQNSTRGILQRMKLHVRTQKTFLKTRPPALIPTHSAVIGHLPKPITHGTASHVPQKFLPAWVLQEVAVPVVTCDISGLFSDTITSGKESNKLKEAIQIIYFPLICGQVCYLMSLRCRQIAAAEQSGGDSVVYSRGKMETEKCWERISSCLLNSSLRKLVCFSEKPLWAAP